MTLARRRRPAYTRHVNKALSGLLVALVALAGCRKSTDLAPYREQALALVARYAPQLAAQRDKIDTLAARLGALPAGQPGAAEVTATLARDRDAIGTLQAVIDRVPGQAKS